MNRVRVGLWVVAGVYWAALFVLTHTPKLPPPPGGVSDKTAHLVAYAMLAGVLYLAGWTSWPAMRGLGWRVLGVCAAYGAVDEWIQAVPWVGRSCELRDWLADVLGAAIMVTLMGAVRRAVARRAVQAKMGV